MASAFYSRYIPPVISAIERTASPDTGVPPKKRRKRKQASDFQSVKPLDSIQVQDARAATESQSHRPISTHDQKKRKNSEGPGNGNDEGLIINVAALSGEADSEGKLNKRKRKKQPNDETEERASSLPGPALEATTDQTLDEGEKHKQIWSKFEKSSKISVKLAKKAKEAAISGEEKNFQESAPVQTYGLVPLPQPPEALDTTGGFTSSTLPKWLRKPLVVSSLNTVPFKELNLSPSIHASLEAKGYKDAFAIQSAIIPMLLQGPNCHTGDLCISAATGSGKTLAYTLPMVETLKDKPIRQLRGLVVVPTRELVTQVRESLQICIAGTGLKIGTAVGSKTLKEEQVLLVHKGRKYDPEGYDEAKRKQAEEEADVMNWDLDYLENSEDELDCLVDFIPEHTSKVDILICTPGRLVDHMKSTKGFNLEQVQWLVIDEADRLLDESFQQWIDVVLPALEAQPILDSRKEMILNMFHVPRQRTVRKIILSATMTRDVSKLIPLKLRQPQLVVLENNRLAEPLIDPSSTVTTSVDLPVTLSELAISIPNVEDKPLYLLKTLSIEKIESIQSKIRRPARQKHVSDGDSSTSSDSDTSSSGSTSSGSDSDSSPSSSPKPQDLRIKSLLKSSESVTHGTLVFTNSNESAMRLARLLCLLRPSWAEKIGSLTKSSATSTGRKTLTAFRKRKLSILVASDRASRGLDIPDLAQVINYNMPTSATSYIHRIGRTARAGKPGLAVTLVAHHEARWFWNEIGRSEQIHRGAGKKVNRIDWKSDSISTDERSAYEAALAKLGQEARGG